MELLPCLIVGCFFHHAAQFFDHISGAGIAVITGIASHAVTSCVSAAATGITAVIVRATVTIRTAAIAVRTAAWRSVVSKILVDEQNNISVEFLTF